ncbi:MAG: MBL fold metallo-hydrolase [Armatimonadota bacterium]|nr:MBL fold metallo-hydrolase [Armatimonadota bacterium]MDR7439150.1 MBL fold metallo-hydrolase [Armatimonadota bacterium]MDR7562129.1 MBL fold metallo-hydrolase [Armatimonadota bacterium]MDR7567516.1 MBL fold metallo-hydrolase [Armatimonadota bacterium]MDR7602297.1 MBL fold metallo-hydrolase [Armatimonadota bacterium]
MAELVRLSEGVYCLPGGVNVGVVAAPDGGAVVVDTGGDRDYGRAIRRALEARGLALRAIVNTHSHADHYGGNDYLLRNVARVPVWAPVVEEAILRHPLLEPIFLFGGASPPEALRTKWLMGTPSPVDHVYGTEEGELEVVGVRLRVHRAGGHAIRMAALGAGPVCFAADAFFGPEVLAKYEIPFAHHVAEQLATLRRLRSWPYEWFVPGHGAPVPRDRLEEVVEANVRAIERGTDRVLNAVKSGPATTSEVVHAVSRTLAQPPATLAAYVLLHTTVLAHLSELRARGEVEPVVEGGALRWVRR